jgi:RNA polymerase sigma-70 factor (ECF subfamily)
LPEPIVEEHGLDAIGQVELAESLSMAFLVLLDSLSPVERAVFLLREVFDYGYDDISVIVQKTEDNCRQIFARAKARIERGKPRFDTSLDKRDELASRFLAACEAGNLDGLVELLAADATFYGDGGGKAAAILQPVHGKERVARLVHGIFVKVREIGARARPVIVNGQPGAMTFDSADRVINVFALDIAHGAVQSVRSVINPDKLQHLGSVSEVARLPRPHLKPCAI